MSPFDFSKPVDVAARYCTITVKSNGDIQIPLVDGFSFLTMSFTFCYVASVNPSLPSNITYPYRRSIFQNWNFSILIADSGSSQKSSYTNYFHFSKILMGTWSKLQKTNKFEGKFNLPSFFMVFLDFGCVPVRIPKRMKKACVASFYRGSQICNQN